MKHLGIFSPLSKFILYLETNGGLSFGGNVNGNSIWKNNSNGT